MKKVDEKEANGLLHPNVYSGNHKRLNSTSAVNLDKKLGDDSDFNNDLEMPNLLSQDLYSKILRKKFQRAVRIINIVRRLSSKSSVSSSSFTYNNLNDISDTSSFYSNTNGITKQDSKKNSLSVGYHSRTSSVSSSLSNIITPSVSSEVLVLTPSCKDNKTTHAKTVPASIKSNADTPISPGSTEYQVTDDEEIKQKNEKDVKNKEIKAKEEKLEVINKNEIKKTEEKPNNVPTNKDDKKAEEKLNNVLINKDDKKVEEKPNNIPINKDNKKAEEKPNNVPINKDNKKAEEKPNNIPTNKDDKKTEEKPKNVPINKDNKKAEEKPNNVSTKRDDKKAEEKPNNVSINKDDKKAEEKSNNVSINKDDKKVGEELNNVQINKDTKKIEKKSEKDQDFKDIKKVLENHEILTNRDINEKEVEINSKVEANIKDNIKEIGVECKSDQVNKNIKETKIYLEKDKEQSIKNFQSKGNINEEKEKNREKL